MVEQIYNLNIEGYWRFKNIHGMPKYSGVYFVYEAYYNQLNDTVLLQRLLYIGESENIQVRVVSHNKTNEWLNSLKQGNELCFSAGYVDSNNRKRVEAALIYKLKPPINTELKDTFPYEDTKVIPNGKTALLSKDITVLQSR